MSWSRLSLVSDAELGQLESEATATAAPWGATTWADERAEAKRDLKIWLELDFPQIVGVADRVLDRWNPDVALAYTGSAYSDVTAEVSDNTEEDLNLATVFTTIANDRIYIGAAWEFDGVVVKLLDSLNATTSVLTAKYWGPAGWTSLSATDGTATGGKTLAKTGRVTWTTPSDWERRDLDDAGHYYWVELSVSAALTAGTAATQILPIRAPDALKRICAYLALYHVFNGLAAGAAVPEAWQKKAETYWTRAKDLYGAAKTARALWLDLDESGAITPPTETSSGATVSLYRG